MKIYYFQMRFLYKRDLRISSTESTWDQVKMKHFLSQGKKDDTSTLFNSGIVVNRHINVGKKGLFLLILNFRIKLMIKKVPGS